jgi:hypothetical protein
MAFWFKRRLVPSVRELLLKESSKSLPMQMYSEERELERSPRCADELEERRRVVVDDKRKCAIALLRLVLNAFL